MKWNEELYIYIISPHVQNSSSYSNIKSMAKVNIVARFPAEHEQFGFRFDIRNHGLRKYQPMALPISAVLPTNFDDFY